VKVHASTGGRELREQRCWEGVTGRGSHSKRESLHSQDSKAVETLYGSLKNKTRLLTARGSESVMDIRASHDLKASENTLIFKGPHKRFKAYEPTSSGSHADQGALSS
jgi:hypothetical protein